MDKKKNKRIIEGIVAQGIFQTLNFKGTRMIFPYKDEQGRYRYAILDGRKIMKAIKFGCKRSNGLESIT